MNKSRKVLVTGAAGFIGSHLSEKLIKLGYAVTGVDNLSTGRISNLNGFLESMTFIEGDLLDDGITKKLFKEKDIYDCIFHVAAVPSVVRSIDNPVESHKNNIDLSFNLLMLAKEFGVKRFVYSASSSAYGQQTGEFKSESMSADPLSPYALQKWVGEKYCHYFHSFFGLETIALRYFNVFGPRQNPASMYAAVIPKFITSALLGEPTPVHGDGLQARDFTYVDNVIDANLKAFYAPITACGKTFNVAMGQSTDLITIIKKLETILQKQIHIEYLPERPGDIKTSKASIDKIIKEIGYEPLVDLSEGLKRTADYIKQSELVTL